MSRSVEKRLEAQLGRSRNSAVLASFVAYCKRNPDMRFYQALRNWSGAEAIFYCHDLGIADDNGMSDTFSWEGIHG
jgi:hypothetical protein